MLYIIRNEHGFIWSNENGWVDAGSVPTIFTQDDYQTLALPVGVKCWWEVLDLRLPGQKA